MDLSIKIKDALNLVAQFKQASNPNLIILNDKKEEIAKLEPVQETQDHIQLISEWRKTHYDAYPTQFPVTLSGTKIWLKKQLLLNPERIIFMIKTSEDQIIGHIGLTSIGVGGFGFSEDSCEIDSVVRGRTEIKGLMQYSLLALCNWAQHSLNLKSIYLRVFSDNSHAIKFYEKCGFTTVGEIPLKKVVEGDVTQFIAIEKGDQTKAHRIFTLMALTNTQT